MNLLIDGIKKDLVIETDMTRKLTIGGHTDVYKVYKIDIDCLFFNDKNDRIATWISQYKADNNISELDMSDIVKYNSIIQEFIEKSNQEAIKKTQNNIELVDQREPGVVLLDGRVIDGNRRFTCLRNLAKKNQRFRFFEAVILEKDLINNAKQIKMLELMIQHGEESKVDYNPIDKLAGIYNDIIDKELITNKEYAQSTNNNLAEVNKQIEISKLLVEFLEFINAPKQFYIARDLELNGPLHELYRILNNARNNYQKEDIKTVAFTNFLVQPHGDMTRFIRKINTVAKSKYLNEYLEEQIEFAEEILDKLPEEGRVTKKVISDIFRSDEKSRENLKRSLEKAEMKAKATETRNRPLQILEKTCDSIESIDVNIFSKLSEEQLSSIKAQIDLLEEKINELKGFLDV
ncbi:hypothetical protein [Clostridium perfringens]